MNREAGLHGHLRVDREAFVRGLGNVRQSGPVARLGEAVWSFAAGALRIRCGGVTVDLPATGAWEGRARLPGRVVRLVARRDLPGGDPVTIVLRGNTLSVNTITVACV
jgi:hypothetical protein